MTYEQAKEITGGYIEAMLWSEELDDRFAEGDVTPEAEAEIRGAIMEFVANAETCGLLNITGRSWWVQTDPGSVPEGMPLDDLGRDIYFTRNHHGVGFWDRGLGKAGDELTDLAQKLGESWPYVTDDERFVGVEG